MPKTMNILTISETDRLLNALRNPKGPNSQTAKSFRNFLLTLFMLDAGLRRSEAIQLKHFMICQGNQPTNVLTVPAEIAKNHKARAIPLTPRLKSEIGYLIDNSHVHDHGFLKWYIFHTDDPRKHMTARRVHQVISRAGQAVLGKRIWPHMLRHTFATRLMRVTSIRVVQELLGHSKLTSTQIYTHPDSQDLLEAIEKL